MTVYLEANPNPNLRQYRNPRRAAPTGAIVIHTAENATDVNPPDTGAEAVARYISTRTNYGSYHSIVDSDTTVHVGEYGWEMFHEGTGGNRWSLGLSFACQASQWLRLPEAWVDSALTNGAIEAARMAAWVQATVGVTVPARRITAAQYRAGEAGFISHAELDPGRRSDPGTDFPWNRFLAEFADFTNQTPDLTPPQETPMDEYCMPANREATIRESQQVLADAGFYAGAIDGDWYTASNLAVHAMKNALATTADDLRVTLAELDSARSRSAVLASDVVTLKDQLEAAKARIAGLEAQLAAAAPTGLSADQERLIEIGAAWETIRTGGAA